jgi:hypothetical protein
MQNIKIYMAKYLWKHGYPCTLISEPLAQEAGCLVEWFAFTTGHERGFKAGTIEFPQQLGMELDVSRLQDIAAHEAANALVDSLGRSCGDSHEALLFTIFCNLTEKRAEDLLELHLRGHLPADIGLDIVRLSSSPLIQALLRDLTEQTCLRKTTLS